MSVLSSTMCMWNDDACNSVNILSTTTSLIAATTYSFYIANCLLVKHFTMSSCIVRTDSIKAFILMATRTLSIGTRIFSCSQAFVVFQSCFRIETFFCQKTFHVDSMLLIVQNRNIFCMNARCLVLFKIM